MVELGGDGGDEGGRVCGVEGDGGGCGGDDEDEGKDV